MASPDGLRPNVRTALHFNGANNAVATTDTAPTPKAVTFTGNAKLTTANVKYGTACLALDGTGDYLTIGAAADWSWMHFPDARWTWEGWVRLNSFAANNTLFSTSDGSTGNKGAFCGINPTSRTIELQIYRGVSSSFVVQGSFATALPNDSNYHHVAITYDHTLASNNAKLYVDGVASGTLTKTANAPSSAAATAALKLGGFSTTGDFNGNMDDVRITHGVRYTAAFTPETEEFSDVSTITPTTWSPTDKAGTVTLSNGNLTSSTPHYNASGRSSYGASTGKWYWEFTFDSGFPMTGIGRSTAAISNGAGASPGDDANGWGFYLLSGNKSHNTVSVAYMGVGVAGDTYGVCLDMDAGTISIVQGGVILTTAFNSITGPIFAMHGSGASATSVVTANFGAGTFKYEIPAGYNPGLGVPGVSLSGNVKNTAGANVARTVRIYREDTGALVATVVSDAGTGDYIYMTGYAGAHTIVFMPGGGEAVNALVLSGVIPA